MERLPSTVESQFDMSADAIFDVTQDLTEQSASLPQPQSDSLQHQQGDMLTGADSVSGVFLSSDEAAFLQEIYDDLDGMPIAVRRSLGAKLCRRFAESVGMRLAQSPATRCAVFGDEEDGVTLLAHSRASSREVSFEFGIDEPVILIVSIDEDLRLSKRACGMDKVRTLAEAVAWLTPS